MSPRLVKLSFPFLLNSFSACLAFRGWGKWWNFILVGDDYKILIFIWIFVAPSYIKISLLVFILYTLILHPSRKNILSFWMVPPLHRIFSLANMHRWSLINHYAQSWFNCCYNIPLYFWFMFKQRPSVHSWDRKEMQVDLYMLLVRRWFLWKYKWRWEVCMSWNIIRDHNTTKFNKWTSLKGNDDDEGTRREVLN
jgi:hypothetical protein